MTEETYSAVDLKITVQKGEGSPVDISEYIDTFNELNKEAPIEDVTGFGEAWARHKASGIKRGQPITFEGFYVKGQDTAVELLNDIGAEVAVEITWGGTDKDVFVAIIQNFIKRPVKDQLSRFACTLQPSGPITDGSGGTGGSE